MSDKQCLELERRVEHFLILYPQFKAYFNAAKPEAEEDITTDIGWYVSDVHCRRAIGYLGAELAGRGDLRLDFEQPRLLEIWGEALSATMDVTEPSPIGPDVDLAKRFINASP